MTEGAGPGRPAPAGNQLPLTRIRPAVLLEVLFTDPAHFLEPGVVRATVRRSGGLIELSLQQRPEWAEPVLGLMQAGGKPIPAVDPFPLLHDQAGFLEQAEVSRHAGLRQAENASELRDVQPLGRKQPQQAQPGVVTQEAEQGRAGQHIYKSILIDSRWQVGSCLYLPGALNHSASFGPCTAAVAAQV